MKCKVICQLDRYKDKYVQYQIEKRREAIKTYILA